jgi:hypothetical protein
MQLKIIVVDNSQSEALRLIDYLKEAFSEHVILPPRDGKDMLVFNDWAQVFEYVGTINDEVAVVCTDLGLKEEDYEDILRGLNKGREIRDLKPDWVLLAYTRWGLRAMHEPAYREAFDGLIEKGDLDPLPRAERIAYVRRIVQSAIGARAGRLSGDVQYELVDSLGMRIFIAAFNKAAVAEIIQNEAADWKDVSLSALTTGHSGAFMLGISGRTLTGPQSLVLKVARSVNVIQRELIAQVNYLGQLGPLATYLSPLDHEPRTLRADVGVYYRQARIGGQPLLELMQKGRWPPNKKYLKRIVNLCLDVCRGTLESNPAPEHAVKKFNFTPLDISRLESSSSFLVGLGDTLRERGHWPVRVKPSAVVEGLMDLVNNWSDFFGDRAKVWFAVQHGDLNPGNVMVLPDGTPRLIDLARLGSWPVGYDLARLSLMLRLRLMGTRAHQDWLPDHLGAWYGEPVATVDGISHAGTPLCPEAAYCDQQFGEFLASAPAAHAGHLAVSYKLGTLWDLLKVISYQDISPFKKVWAALECWRLKSELVRGKKGNR